MRILRGGIGGSLGECGCRAIVVPPAAHLRRHASGGIPRYLNPIPDSGRGLHRAAYPMRSAQARPALHFRSLRRNFERLPHQWQGNVIEARAMPATAVTKAEFLLTKGPPESFTGQKSSITLGYYNWGLPFGFLRSDAAPANSRKQASIISDVICRQKAVWLVSGIPFC